MALYSGLWLLGSCLVHLLMGIEGNQLNCQRIGKKYEERGITTNDLPLHPVPDVRMNFCGRGPTCCDTDLLHGFLKKTEWESPRMVRLATRSLIHVFKSRARKFDGFFRDLLDHSKRELHKVFKNTYGMMYESNSYIFTDLFDDLEKYYQKGTVDLSVRLDAFFHTLYQKMFTIYNAQYEFNDRYLQCITEHMEQLKPFKDVPDKLSIDLRRSFLATRTFHQALTAATEILSDVIKPVSTDRCIQGLLKLLYCPVCRGYGESEPCNAYCINVLKGCMVYHTELGQHWDAFIEALVNVSERLEGPFNIEHIVEPINLKISDAIMNFQRSGEDVTQVVFQGCGTPRLGKRDLPPTIPPHQEYQIVQSQKEEKSEPKQLTLEKLVRDIRNKVKVTKGYWRNLPYQVCSEQFGTRPGDEGPCWNGQDIGSYTKPIVGDGLKNQSENPEVWVETSRPRLSKQVFLLRLITDKLEKAYNGLDVNWQEYDKFFNYAQRNDDEYESSGSGDNARLDLLQTDDEDYYQAVAEVGSGSGDGGVELWGGQSGNSPNLEDPNVSATASSFVTSSLLVALCCYVVIFM